MLCIRNCSVLFVNFKNNLMFHFIDFVYLIHQKINVCHTYSDCGMQLLINLEKVCLDVNFQITCAARLDFPVK